MKRFSRFAQNGRKCFAQNGRISIFVLLSVLISCEKVVDFPRDPSGLIYIDAVVGEESNRINVQVSQPLEGSEDADAEDVMLSLEADGKPVELVRDLEYESRDGEVSYIASSSLSHGQNLLLRASAEGLPSVEARTVVPEPLPDVEISSEIIDSYKVSDPGYIHNDRLAQLFNFRFVMDEEPQEDSFFGVQIFRRKLYDYIGMVDERDKEYYDSLCEEGFDDIYINSEPVENPALSSIKVEMVMDFDGGEMKVAPALSYNGKALIEVQVERTDRTLIVGSYGNTPEDNYQIYKYYEYKFKVYRLSKEMYHCLRARYIVEYSDAPIHLGFTPVTYTYTNIEGGLGLFGAVSLYETDWQSYENE